MNEEQLKSVMEVVGAILERNLDNKVTHDLATGMFTNIEVILRERYIKNEQT